MNNLCIGVIDLTPKWKEMLDQLGVWYEELDPAKDLFTSYSAIIVNDSIRTPDRNLIKDYLKEGGNLILIVEDQGFFPDITFNWTYKKRVINNLGMKDFQHIPYLDLHTRVKSSSTPGIKSLLRFKRVMKGNIAFIGFDPAELIFETGYIRKPFYTTVGDPPDEIVSKVSKGYITDLFIKVLKEIHFREGLPFVRKWTSPKVKPVFCFRIDTDYSDKAHIDQVYDLIANHEIKATWFLHIDAHKEWLSHFKTLEEQEIALHGFKHATSSSAKKIKGNISLGLTKLSESGIEVSGYCAPYGIYNKALERSVDEFAFKYTSEFTYAYDTIPMRTASGELQIPIHPICTGSLKRKSYSLDEMRSYFLNVMDMKSASYSPILFYHHPLQPGLEVFDSVFQKSKKENLTNLTFKEYADFCKRRNSCSFRSRYNGKKGFLERVSNESILFEISFEHSSSEIISGSNQTFDRANDPTIQYHYPEYSQLTETDQGMINKLKLLKTSILDYRNRERL